MARKSKQLEEIKDIIQIEELKEIDFENLTIETEFVHLIKENALYIVDIRYEGKILHSIDSILLSVIFALLAKCDTFEEIELFMSEHYEWLDKHIKFENGLPSISTVKRVIGFINPKELEQVCVSTFNEFLKQNEPLYKDGFFVIEDIKSMDGKTANSSDRKTSKNGSISKMNAMSILSVKNNITEATEFIENKTNEIPTGITLLKRVNIKDSIIVFDAMSTQTDTIKYICEQKGHYVAPVKGNQGTLEECIREYFEDEDLYKKVASENRYIVTEKAHGTYEEREYVFTNDIDWYYKKEEWASLKSIGMAKRTYEKDGKTISDIRYFISDLDASKIEIISKAIREEWAIENKLHWNLDMVFKEDDNKCFLGNSQKNLNIMRKLCLGLLSAYKKQTNLSMNSIRHLLSMNFEKRIVDILVFLYQ